VTALVKELHARNIPAQLKQYWPIGTEADVVLRKGLTLLTMHDRCSVFPKALT
jgi:hypothetical protein